MRRLLNMMLSVGLYADKFEEFFISDSRRFFLAEGQVKNVLFHFFNIYFIFFIFFYFYFYFRDYFWFSNYYCTCLFIYLLSVEFIFLN